jgi:hypothetical protein
MRKTGPDAVFLGATADIASVRFLAEQFQHQKALQVEVNTPNARGLWEEGFKRKFDATKCCVLMLGASGISPELR